MTPSKAMVDKLLRGCTSAGQAEMAKLAYQMARTCLSYAEGTTGYIRWFEALRDVTGLRRDIERLERRTGLDIDTDTLPLASPTREFAVASGRSCLDFQERIEGNSTRILYYRALFCRADGAPDEAADRLEHMLRSPLDKAWHAFVQEGRQLTLLGLGRHSEVATISNQMLSGKNDRPIAIFNLATAAAWLGEEAQFRAAAARLRGALAEVSDLPFWERVVSAEAIWFAERLKLDPAAVTKCFSLPSHPSRGPRSET